MARIAKKPIHWPAWRYGPDGQAEMFLNPNDVPDGWTKTPNPTPLDYPDGEKLDFDALREAVKAKGIKVNAQWPAVYLKTLLEN